MGTTTRKITKKSRVALFLLFLIQVAFTNAYLPVTEWFSDNPIYTDDYSFHYSDVLYKSECAKRYNMFFGYNPNIRAGTINQAAITVDNYGWVLFTLCLPFISAGCAFKLYLILTLLSIPFMLFFSARNFDLGIKESIICSVLGTAFVQISVCADFLYYGMVSFVLISYLSLLVMSLFYKYFTYRKLSILLLATLCLTACLWCHLFTIACILFPFFLCYILFFRKLLFKDHIRIFLSALIVILLNIIWLLPCFIIMGDFVSNFANTFIYTTSSVFEPLKTYLFFDPKFNEYNNIPFPKSGFVDLFLLAFGIIAIIKWKNGSSQQKALFFAGSVFFFFMLAYYGSFSKTLINLTPLRFVVPLNIFLCVPAAEGICTIYNKFIKNKNLKIKYTVLAAVLLIVLTLLIKPYYQFFIKNTFKLSTSFPPQMEELISWITDNTDNSGRILVENSDWESNHQYYGGHFPQLLPQLTNRAYLGNYIYQAKTNYSACRFISGYFCDRKIAKNTVEKVWKDLQLYNTKWIIVWSKDSMNFFSSSPEYYKFIKKIDKFFVFETKRPGNFFIKGKGEIKAGINKIELSNLVPENGEIIISYHWVKYFKTEPHTILEKTHLRNDLAGFITLKNPSEKVVIDFSYSKFFKDWPNVINFLGK